MKTGRRGGSRGWRILTLWLVLSAGCASAGPHLDRDLQANKPRMEPDPQVAACYAVGFPDVLEIRVAGRPELSGLKDVGADGRIDLGDLGRLRVDGKTTSEVADCVARVAGVAAGRVRVGVAEYRSRQVFLFGQVFGLQRAVAYQGPETVLAVLQRAGGVRPGAAAEDVALLRPRVGDGKPPEIFQIDLQAIATGGDQSTNLRVEPGDQIYVGETHGSCVARCVPPCLRPLTERLAGLYRAAPFLRAADRSASRRPSPRAPNASQDR